MKPGERILGVEGGGTKTAWVLAETVAGVNAPSCEFRVIDHGKLPPSNFRLTTSDRLRTILAELPKQIDRAGVFLAGCGTEEDRSSLKQICLEVWPNAKIVTGSDRDSGLAAALDHGDGIVVNAGSGSSVTGRRGNRIERAGGWGHILGDAGGGLFHRDSIYTHAFRRRLKKNLPDARVAIAERAPELGAALLAAEAGGHATFHANPSQNEIDSLAAALTEQRNPRSENLEKMNGRELVEVFVEEEKFVQEALRAAVGELARAIEIVAESLRNGGRLFYTGAGSSGRIGVLDASEIPPTFGAQREL